MNKLEEYLKDIDMDNADRDIIESILRGFYGLYGRKKRKTMKKAHAKVIGNILKTALGTTIALRDDR